MFSYAEIYYLGCYKTNIHLANGEEVFHRFNNKFSTMDCNH